MSESTGEGVQPDHEPTTIIVLGDWIIDNYYFLKPNDAGFASARGYAHYDVVSQPTKTIRDLCGAGHLAHALATSNLASSGSEQIQQLRLVGLGLWNTDDTDLIRHLVHAHRTNDCTAPQLGTATSPALARCTVSSGPAIDLWSLAPAQITQRVIRMYHLRNGRFEQISRLDIGSHDSPTSTPQLPADLLAPPDSVIAIVVHDMARGAVTKDVVSELHTRYPKAHWFVRSKSKHHVWLKDIRQSIRFALVGPEILVENNALGTWALRNHATPQAFKMIDSIGTDGVVALLTDGGTLVARLADGNTVATMHVPTRQTEVSQLRWASSVFTSVVLRQVEDRSDEYDPIDGDLLLNAMKTAVGHTGIPEVDIPDFMAVPLSATAPGKAHLRDDGSPSKHPTTHILREEIRNWDKAFQDHGIIDGSLEVWRGASVLPGYITIIKERQEIVLRLARLLREFVTRGRSASPLNILLQSDPGTGKTALAEALAEAVGARLIREDISRMTRREQVQDLFDAIAAVQTVEDSPIIVFVDEINATVEQSPVYSQFLGPLDQRPYFRAGSRFQLRPCAWIFAGTNVPESELTAADKFSDFRSRLFDRVAIDYRSLSGRFADFESDSDSIRKNKKKERERVEREARLEQVYLGAMRIGAHFPEVVLVARNVLDVFYDIDPGSRVSPSRRINRLVSQIRSPHSGTVTHDNCLGWSELEDINWTNARSLVRMVW